ncbi:VOC family protein [Actinocorallia aurea]
MSEVTDPYATGTPCWVDLMAKDHPAALEFYHDLFGWQGEVGPAEFGGYSTCELHGKAVAGIGPTMAPEGMPEPPTVWTTYLASTDISGTQDAIVAAGGTLIAPVMEIGDLGRMLVAADSQGAVFGVWQAGTFPGTRIVGESGAPVWHELHTPDIERAAAFYGAVFGIEIVPMQGGDSYWELQAGGRTVGGAGLLESDPPGVPPHWRVYFAADDVDATVAVLTEHGGKVLTAPFDMAAGRMAVVTDPQGAPFALLHPIPM